MQDVPPDDLKPDDGGLRGHEKGDRRLERASARDDDGGRVTSPANRREPRDDVEPPGFSFPQPLGAGRNALRSNAGS